MPTKYVTYGDSHSTSSEWNNIQPEVSVILPIYNTARYLDQALDSVQNQSLRNIEIICINDGSTDNSLEIMTMHAMNDSRIRVIDKQNEGYGAGCNRGLDEAHGRYIAIVEPDDWIESNMYQDMLEFASTFDGEPDIIKTPYWRIWMPDTPEQRKLNCSYRKRVNPKKQPFTISDPGAVHLLTHHPSIWSAIYRADFLRDNSIRFPKIPGAGWADNPFLMESTLKAKTIVYLDQPYYCYREETPEKSANFAIKNTMIPFERWNDMKDIMDEMGVTDDGILRAHNSRGFTYLSGVLEQNDIEDPAIHDAALAMFNRMDDDIVFGDPEVSPGWKRKYAELKGIEAPAIKKLPYIKGIISQGLYALNNVGIEATIDQTMDYFKKRKIREGGQK